MRSAVLDLPSATIARDKLRRSLRGWLVACGKGPEPIQEAPEAAWRRAVTSGESASACAAPDASAGLAGMLVTLSRRMLRPMATGAFISPRPTEELIAAPNFAASSPRIQMLRAGNPCEGFLAAIAIH